VWIAKSTLLAPPPSLRRVHSARNPRRQRPKRISIRLEEVLRCKFMRCVPSGDAVEVFGIFARCFEACSASLQHLVTLGSAPAHLAKPSWGWGAGFCPIISLLRPLPFATGAGHDFIALRRTRHLPLSRSINRASNNGHHSRSMRIVERMQLQLSLSVPYCFNSQPFT